MIRHCIALAIAGLAVLGACPSAHAQTADEQFEDAVTALGITVGPEVDIVAQGRNVCTTLTDGIEKNVNPVPVVRGVVMSLQNSNLTKEQAVGFMQASVAAYCPNYLRVIGR
jgi:hypothetical protein